MFLLYPILAGLLLGLLLGGRWEGLERARLRWAPAAVAALLAQVALFSAFVATRIGDAGPPIYLATSALVVAVAARNARQPGLLLVAIGGASNLLAIASNGGYMPADPAALSAAAVSIPPAYSSGIVAGANVALRPLTDVFAMPAWLPLANVFSVGDMLVGLGVCVWLVATMGAPRLRGRRWLRTT